MLNPSVLLAWSQDQLAQKSGVSVPTIKRLEANDAARSADLKSRPLIIARADRISPR
jgi:transcriptional regulator with XRE-family HTH domain